MENIEYIVTPNSDTALPAVRSKDISIDQALALWTKIYDSEDDQRSSRPLHPYEQVDLVFTCVNKLIAGIFALAPVISKANEDIIEYGPAYDTLFNNPALTWERFLTDTIGHYALSRDVFWVFPDKPPGAPPAETFVISGTQMHALTDNRRSDGRLIGWEFRGSGGQMETFSLDEVYQWKNFNPYDRFHGLGPATAAQLNINYTYAATLFNSAALEGGAELGPIVTLPPGVTMNDDEKRFFISNMEARHAGAGKPKRIALLTGGADVKTVAQNMVEMDVANLASLSGNRVCSCFGVPPAVAGLVTEAQYAHGPAQHDFIFNTIIPLAELASGHITAGLLKYFTADVTRGVRQKEARYFLGRQTIPLQRNKEFRRARAKAAARQQDLFFWFDSSGHPVVQQATEETANKVLKYTEAGVKLNNIIEAHDLPYEMVPWGDHHLVNMSLVPAQWIIEAGPEGFAPPMPEGQTEEEEGKSIQHSAFSIQHSGLSESSVTKESQAAKLRLWNNWRISWAGLEKEYTTAERKLFVRQNRELVDKLKKAWRDYNPKSFESSVPSVAKNTEAIIARVVLDLKKEDGKIKVINDIFFDQATELGIRQGLTESTALKDEEFEAAVHQVKNHPRLNYKKLISARNVASVNRTTQDLIARQLRTGLQAGEDLNSLTRRINNVLGNNLHRARRIARTQTSGALSGGRHEAFQAAGIKLKSWITSGDPQVRDSHRTAGVDYHAGIAVAEPFIVGGAALMFPGDPAGPPGEIVNCRCLAVARRGNKTLSVDFYTYEKMQAKNKEAT